jgi:hypothetical protein
VKLTYEQRQKSCEKHFWMQSKWTVTVRCKVCHRHQEAQLSDVMGLDGVVRLSPCSSCGTLTCAPVLKDHKTLAEVPE